MRRDLRTHQQAYRYHAIRNERAGDIWKAHKHYRELIMKGRLK